MCAICGIGILKSSTMKDSNKLKEFFTKLLCACQDGGRSASGVSFMREKKVDVLRRGISASELVQTLEYKNLINQNIELGLTETNNRLFSILGHCRIPTKGSPLNNKNNHPVVVKNIIGVHNGCISNDNLLFETFKLQRIAEVDTEAIFSMASYLTTQAKTTQEALEKLCGMLQGSYACALQNANHPYNLYLFRGFNGTHIRHYTEAGLIVLATTETYIERASEGLNLGKYEPIPYKTETGITFNLYTEKLSRFEIQNKRGDRSYYE
jgi:glucosamine 6-phosphate synthetase-like amidotransferase/phosphosugar isomerase protein